MGSGPVYTWPGHVTNTAKPPTREIDLSRPAEPAPAALYLPPRAHGSHLCHRHSFVCCPVLFSPVLLYPHRGVMSLRWKTPSLVLH
ncbi:hypothetical protein N7510_002471 [Penicillium lagena]|uniref:uncharacterized protein n=1 Tax=Penicillium lagena TaxID=94218 RepID=UPI00253F8BA1|nr:uncharacterized protein N7510_002471 [Penicillium lagena]KAJ5626162.1 hypothetical protein N7510_002471 [Penicillium lagena]